MFFCCWNYPIRSQSCHAEYSIMSLTLQNVEKIYSIHKQKVVKDKKQIGLKVDINKNKIHLEKLPNIQGLL